jgi:hypothetical protein
VTELSDESRTEFGVPQILVTHHVWIDWTRIARRHLREARVGRQRALEARASGESMGPGMEAEFEASLVTVAAASHALDGLYGALRDLVQIDQLSQDAPRHAYLRAVLKAAFSLRNEQTKRWKAEFTWLFDLRDSAVHHKVVTTPTVTHPIEGFGSEEAARYYVESAERAMRLLLDVLRFLGSQDNARTAAVRSYVAGVEQTVRDDLLRQ